MAILKCIFRKKFFTTNYFLDKTLLTLRGYYIEFTNFFIETIVEPIGDVSIDVAYPELIISILLIALLNGYRKEIDKKPKAEDLIIIIIPNVVFDNGLLLVVYIDLNDSTGVNLRLLFNDLGYSVLHRTISTSAGIYSGVVLTTPLSGEVYTSFTNNVTNTRSNRSQGTFEMNVDLNRFLQLRSTHNITVWTGYTYSKPAVLGFYTYPDGLTKWMFKLDVVPCFFCQHSVFV